MENQKKYVELGIAKSAHGVKGEITLNLYNTEDSVLESGQEVLLVPLKGSELPSGGSTFTIGQLRFGNKVILTLDGIDDRTAAEKILPFKICLDRKLFKATDEGEIYLTDLMGLEVYNLKGKFVGKVSSTFNHGAVDNIVIELDNGGELTLPFVNAFFVSVDLKQGRITITDVEYL